MRVREIRAVLVLVHVVAVCVLATPDLDSTLSRRAWKHPTVQQELGAWAGRLSGIGVEVAPAELEAWAWTTAVRWTRLRNVIAAPFGPYVEQLGVRQRWHVFAAPHRFPERLAVDVREDGHWREVFVLGSDEHDWRRRQLTHDRMRTAIFRYGWPQYRSNYGRFCAWLAARASHDFPRADTLRCRLQRARTPTPAEARRGERPASEHDNVVEMPVEAAP
jgi:hypothetical protein